MTDSSSLFRREVLETRSEQRFGSVLIHQPPSYYIIAVISLAMVTASLALAYFGTYTRKASARGLLMPEQGLFRLVAPSSGQVSTVNVREGQSVDLGQPLFTLTTAQVTSSGPTHLLVRDQLERRLGLAQSSAAYSQDREARELVLVRRRGETLDAELRQLDHEHALLTKREMLAERHRTRVARQAESGFVSQAQLEQAEAELLTVRQQRHSIQRAQAALERDRAQLHAGMEEIRARHQAQLTEVETTQAILRQELAELDARRELISAAPFSGTVTGVHVHEGSIVSAGAVLASVIPDAAKLVAHLYVSEQMSGFLAPGQSVQIRYAAYPYQKYGMASGFVTSVARSPYALSELPPHVASVVHSESQLQSLYYRVVVELDEQVLAVEGKRFSLKAGMVLEADIVQDTRRLYEWALEPIYSVTDKFHRGSGIPSPDESDG